MVEVRLLAASSRLFVSYRMIPNTVEADSQYGCIKELPLSLCSIGPINYEHAIVLFFTCSPFSICGRGFHRLLRWDRRLWASSGGPAPPRSPSSVAQNAAKDARFCLNSQPPLLLKMPRRKKEEELLIEEKDRVPRFHWIANDYPS